jgi:hypothetical protein
MASIFLPLIRLATLGSAFLLAGAAVAQAPDQATGPTKLRQPTPQSVQQQEMPTNADKSRSEADRKVREMDRRLNRTLRSVCVGC